MQAISRFRNGNKVRAQKVETGIADGWSTAVILAAMDANGVGVLHSIDIAAESGALVGDGHPRWHRHLTDGSPGQLADVLGPLGQLDLFVHDSDHSYRAQMGEYLAASRSLRAGALLVSDDVNWSNAFLDFCRAHELRPVVLAEPTSLVGVVRVTAGSAGSDGGGGR